MPADALDPAAVLSLLITVLPHSTSLNSPQDAIAALVHAAMSVLAFRLIGTDDATSVSNFPENVLPSDWNEHGPGYYVFRYRHEQSSLEFVVKVSKLAARTVINAIAVESDKAAMLDVQTEDYTSLSMFPYALAEAKERPLVHAFISSSRITDFLHSYKLKIIQKLVPRLRKEGYTEINEEASSQVPQNQPRPDGPRGRSPPDEHRGPFSTNQPYFPPQNPLSIGRRDLDPLPAHINPFSPPPLFGGPSRGDGMYVGPDHPIFSDRFTPGHAGGSGIGGHHEGPWGGDGFLPPMGAPPGARFDPVGPFGSPSREGLGRGGPLEGPRRQGGPAGTSTRGPDNDEFLPPGVNDMFS